MAQQITKNYLTLRIANGTMFNDGYFFRIRTECWRSMQPRDGTKHKYLQYKKKITRTLSNDLPWR